MMQLAHLSLTFVYFIANFERKIAINLKTRTRYFALFKTVFGFLIKPRKKVNDIDFFQAFFKEEKYFDYFAFLYCNILVYMLL